MATARLRGKPYRSSIVTGHLLRDLDRALEALHRPALDDLGLRGGEEERASAAFGRRLFFWSLAASLHLCIGSDVNERK